MTIDDKDELQVVIMKKKNSVSFELLRLIICTVLFLLPLVALADTLVIPASTKHIMDEAFINDSSITDVILPDGIESVGRNAFAGTNLNTINLPASLNSIADDAFTGCSNILAKVTSGSYAFHYCIDNSIPYTVGKKTYKIGVAIYQFTDYFMALYRNELLNYFKALETDDVKYEITVADGKNDMAEQINQVKNFIAQGMDVIILNLVQTSSADAVIDEIVAAGIPLVLINREPLAYDANGNKLDEEYRGIVNNPAVCFVGADGRQVGTYQGEIVRDLNNHGDINGDGKISYIMIEGNPENVDAQYRTTFSIKALTDAGYEVECLADQIGNWDQTWAREICANALTTYGDKIEVVFCNNDGMALGAYTAIQNAGRKVGTDIYLLGVDALEEALQLIKDGEMTGTIRNDHIGQSHAAVDIAVKLLNGEPIENYYWVDYQKIVNANSNPSSPVLDCAAINLPETVASGKNCSFSFSPVENAASYTASFRKGQVEIVSWGSASALPDTNLTIPGYWLENGNYSITVTASANGYRDSTSTWTFTAEGNERPAPAVEVDIANVFVGDACTFTVNTENANDLRYLVGKKYYTNHINVLDDETEYTTCFYSAGDYEYRFTVRRGNTWSAWSEPVVIHVAEKTIPTAPTINILSTLEEGRDLVVSLSEVTGAIRYGINIYNDDGSIYSNPSLLSYQISSIEVPGYNIAAGSYTISAYSYNGSQYSNTTYKHIEIVDADKPDAPTVEPPENTTVTSYSYVPFVINTTGADRIAIRYFKPGNTDDIIYDSVSVDDGQTETRWSTFVDGSNSWKYSFSVRKEGVWSFWSTPITITIDDNASGTNPQGNGIKIGIINLDPAESGYRRANVKSLNDTFIPENGYDAKFATAPTLDKQLEAAEGFIADGMQYILVCAAENIGWDEVLQEAKDNGIKVLLFDRMIDCDPSLYTAAVVSDMAEEGKTAVAWLESLNLSEYKILHIQGQLGSDAQIGRSNALIEKCASDSRWTIIRQGTGGDCWDPEEARKVAQAAIAAGEDFNIVYAENDGMTSGVVDALDEAGITHGVNGDVIIMGFDCNKWALRKLLAGEWNYDGQCSPFQAPYIDRMIKTLEAGGTITGLNNLNQFITPEIGFDARTITQSDVDKYGLGE